MPKPDKEIRVIENTLLYVMLENQPSDYPIGEYAYSLAFLSAETGLPRDIVRAFCRSLTDQGLASYMRGLWHEDGYPAGSGYGITQAGADRIAFVVRSAA